MPAGTIKLLFVEDNKIDYMAFSREVQDKALPYDHMQAESASEGRELLQAKNFDIVLIDYMLRDGTAFDVLTEVPADTPVIMVTGSGDEEIAVQAMRAGASDYLIKDPLNHWLKTLPLTVDNAIKARNAEEELKRFHAELEQRVHERTEQLFRANEQLRGQIEQREKAEQALRNSEERFRSLTETTSEWIWQVDLHAVFTYSNPRLLDLLGYEPHEIVGKSIFDLMPLDAANDARIKFKAIAKAQEPFKDLECPNIHKNGHVVPLDISGAPYFDIEGQLSGYRGVGRDLTERKKAEELLVRSERLKAVAELSAGVAHNFNNMLQIILTSAEMALGAIKNERLETAVGRLKQIRESCRVGAEIVKSLQDFARSRLEPEPLDGNVFSLSAIVEKAVDMSSVWWKSDARLGGISINLNKDLDPGCMVKGSGAELFEVVVNLIKNAVEALPQGGHITIETHNNGARAVLEVSDNGIGIKESDKKKVFEPFFTTKGFKGSGMGLSSAYGIIVHQLGGEISVDSREGHGTRFVISLPSTTETPEPLRRPALTPTEPLRILVIDDQELIVQMLEQMLKTQGHQVFTAVSGAEGIAVFNETLPDLVICDLSMPEVTGKHVARAVKELCERSDVPKPPFLILTGWGKGIMEEEDLNECGVDLVVEKPIDFTSLMRRIADLATRSTPSPQTVHHNASNG